jgi:hypothetical protein
LCAHIFEQISSSGGKKKLFSNSKFVANVKVAYFNNSTRDKWVSEEEKSKLRRAPDFFGCRFLKSEAIECYYHPHPKKADIINFYSTTTTTTTTTTIYLSLLCCATYNRIKVWIILQSIYNLQVYNFQLWRRSIVVIASASIAEDP